MAFQAIDREELAHRLCDCPSDRTKSYCLMHGVYGRLALLALLVELMQEDVDS